MAASEGRAHGTPAGGDGSAAKGTEPRPSALNSPFVVTLLGGLLVGFLSHLWQQGNSDLAFKRLSWTEAMHERRAVVRDFTAHVAGGLYLSQLYKRHGIWLNEYASRPKLPFPDGRKTFEEERAFYETAAQKLFAAATPDGLVTLIQGTFTSHEVQTQADSYQSAFDVFMNAQEEEVLDVQLKKLNEVNDQLVRAMNREINAMSSSIPTQ